DTHAITDAVREGDADAALQAGQSERAGRRTAPIDHEHSVHRHLVHSKVAVVVIARRASQVPDRTRENWAISFGRVVARADDIGHCARTFVSSSTLAVRRARVGRRGAAASASSLGRVAVYAKSSCRIWSPTILL